MVVPMIVGVVAAACIGATAIGIIAATVVAVKQHKRRRRRRRRNGSSINAEASLSNNCQSLTLSRECGPRQCQSTEQPLLKSSPECKSRYQAVHFQRAKTDDQMLHCMIIAFYGSKPPEGAMAKLKVQLSTGSKRHLPGVKNDVKSIQELISYDEQKQIADVAQVFYAEQTSSTACKHDIRKKMEEIKMKNRKTSNGFLIWYTGHGNVNTGNWPMKDDKGKLYELKFVDIYDLYKKHFRNRPLYIVSDCCYSGAWVKECARLLDQDGIKCPHQARREGMIVKVFACCLPSEQAYDNFYMTKKGVKLHRRHETASVCFAEHQRIGTDERYCQHTLGVDFTNGHGKGEMCVETENGGCVPLSSWIKYVDELIEQPPSRNYLT